MKFIKKKNSLMKEIEQRENINIEELLRIKFVDENKSLFTIANELKITYPTVISWLRKAGIYSRKLDL